MTEEGDEWYDELAPRGRPLPLNSKRLTAAHVQQLARTLGLPITASPVSQRIRSPRKSDPGRIRYASDIDPTLADSIRGINGVIGFPLSTSQSKLWCIHADLT